MNSKTTRLWFALAVALFAFIFVYERYFRPAVAGPAPLLAGFHPAAVTSVQVYPAGASAISADRTNGGWALTKPVSYPAQAAAIEALLDALQKISPKRMTAAELREHPNYETEFGFEDPQATLFLNIGGQSWQVKVGNKTAPGDQVYLRVVGVEGVDVADAAWLKLIPHAADQWRDTALVSAGESGFDWIVVSNNAKGIAIELRRDPTNHLWRILRPLPARADTDRITEGLQRLLAASVTRFITDDPNADLTAFGLQPADLDLWLGQGTNFVAGLHVGKSLTNDASQVYARREGWKAVFTTAREPLALWRGAVTDFRDTRLFELTAPVAEIEVRNTATNSFILREHGSNEWQIVGEKFPVDAASVQQFIHDLAGLRVSEFVKEVVTPPEWPAYGLAPPSRAIILRSKAGDTNAVIAELDFGAARTNGVFVRRPDETSVYAVSLPDFRRVFPADWQFRDRRIWDFNVDDVSQITIHQDGKTRQITHNGPGKWSLTAGTGIIEDKNIEQAVAMCRQLTAVWWFARNFNEADFGFGTNNLQVAFELKNGQQETVDFGAEAPQWKTAVAAVTLDGARWGFLFPPALYQMISAYLTIPANVP